jgi:hypothetical protein
MCQTRPHDAPLETGQGICGIIRDYAQGASVLGTIQLGRLAMLFGEHRARDDVSDYALANMHDRRH